MKNKTILNYTLKYHLGEGGMADVWYAENSIGKKAAIKVLKKEYASHDDVVNRFENEARIMVALEHINIRKVYDFGMIENRPAIIMEYLDGEDLSHKLKHNTHYTNQDLVNWWNQAVEALNYTHEKGIIHRDIKPSNLFITKTGILKLLDFGIAKVKQSFSLTHTGQRMGTLLYMSPEQILDSKHITPATDRYSLAVSFVQLVTKAPPYGEINSESSYEVQKCIVEKDIESNVLPYPWQNLEKYLHKKADKRETLEPFTLEAQSKIKAEETFVQAEEKTEVKELPKKEVVKTKIIDELKEIKEGNETQSKKKSWKSFLFIGVGIIVAFILVFILTKEKYDEIDDFNEGLARVESNGKYGFIDKTGEEVIPLEYDDAESFSEGLAVVYLNWKYGFIDKTGKEITPMKYNSAFTFSEGLAVVLLNGKWGFIDKTGEEVIPLKYDGALSFSEGLALVILNGKCGFIDKIGKEVIPLKYDGAWSFSEGMAKVQSNSKYGFIDKTGRKIISSIYDDAEDFSGGMARVELNGEWFFINKQGERVED